MKLLIDYQTRLDEVLQDLAARLASAAKDSAIHEAVREYSKHRPAVKVLDIPGDGATFDIPLGMAPGPTDWSPGFSVVREVEYPAGERRPQRLEREQWAEYQAPSGWALRLFEVTPAVGTIARITYTALHTVSLTIGTVPDVDFDAVANLAGSHAAQALANSFAQQSDPTIRADGVDHENQSTAYAQRSRELRALYFRHMGIVDEKGAPAASVHADWDQTPAFGGDYLTHPREWR